MDQKPKSRGLKAAILTMSFVQMATNAVSSILANIAAEFPEASVAAVQYLMTFPNLLVVVVSVLAAKLSTRFAKRTLAAVGLALACMAGILSFLFHGGLLCLYSWAGMLGTGIGLAVPIANSLISDYFDGSEKDTLLGYQTSAANVGSMLMTYIGGLIAAWGWYFDYLVYLLAVPGLVLPQCMGQMVTEDKEQSTFLMSVVLAVANLGTFLAPALTGLSAFVMGNNLAGSRFLFTGILSTVLALLSGIFIILKRRKDAVI